MTRLHHDRRSSAVNRFLESGPVGVNTESSEKAKGTYQLILGVLGGVLSGGNGMEVVTMKEAELTILAPLRIRLDVDIYGLGFKRGLDFVEILEDECYHHEAKGDKYVSTWKLS